MSARTVGRPSATPAPCSTRPRWAAGDVGEVARLEAWMWLDGPGAEEGRVGGATRALFLEMNERALRAEDPDEQAELPPAWPRLSEIAVPTLVMIGRLDVEDVQAID